MKWHTLSTDHLVLRRDQQTQVREHPLMKTTRSEVGKRQRSQRSMRRPATERQHQTVDECTVTQAGVGTAWPITPHQRAFVPLRSPMNALLERALHPSVHFPRARVRLAWRPLPQPRAPKASLSTCLQKPHSDTSPAAWLELERPVWIPAPGLWTLPSMAFPTRALHCPSSPS